MIVGVAVSCTIAYLLIFDERTQKESPDQQTTTKRVLESRSTTLSNSPRPGAGQPNPVQTKTQEAAESNEAGVRERVVIRRGAVELDEQNGPVMQARDNARAMADSQPERVVAILRRWLSEDDRKFR